ncbi:MAG: hypothetical protein RIC55_05075 [Pirellulaceae bacterium]
MTPEEELDFSKPGDPVHLFEVATGRRLAYLTLPGESLTDGHVWSLAASPDEKLLYAPVTSGTIYVYDVSQWTGG